METCSSGPGDVRKILAAICFSEYCGGTFELAIALAKSLEAELVLVNVINVRDVAAVSSIESMGYDVHADQYISGVRQERQEQLDSMIAAAGLADAGLKTVFRVGHPFDELMKVIEEEQVDLVVLGAKGRTNLPHVLVGSVAEKLFRHSPVTVVSYRNRRGQGRPARGR